MMSDRVSGRIVSVTEQLDARRRARMSTKMSLKPSYSLDAETQAAQVHPFGATNPLNPCSNLRATSMHMRTPYSGPTIWTPTGRPDFDNPAGATVDGRWATVKNAPQKVGSAGDVGRPFTMTFRSCHSCLGSCGTATVGAAGHIRTSHS